MVQAAAQAQAVVAAAKSRGDGLVPMNQSQIHALSQIQAQAIVHARKSQGTPQQIQTQIQLQGAYKVIQMGFVPALRLIVLAFCCFNLFCFNGYININKGGERTMMKTFTNLIHGPKNMTDNLLFR